MTMAPGVKTGRAVGPLVTIAIPTYNRAALLRGCVQAALAQSYENIEILVSDNASEDETPQVLQEFSDSRLRIIRQSENIGLLPNWNACLAAARGTYVVFLSDDDRIAPWFVQRCYSVIAGRPDIPIVVTLCNFRMADIGEMRPPRKSRLLSTGLHDGGNILTEYLKDDITVVMCSIMLRTDALRAGGGFPLDFPHTADVAAWAPVLCGSEAGFVNEACATYNFHSDSETGRMSVEQILVDGWKMVARISRAADQNIASRKKRAALKLQARRGFARRGFAYLAHYRRTGASLTEVAAFIWRFRRQMMVVEAVSFVRFLAIVLCPRPLAEAMRTLRRTRTRDAENRPAVARAG